MESNQQAIPRQCSSTTAWQKRKLPIQFELSMKGKTERIKCSQFYRFIVVARGWRLFNSSRMYKKLHTQQMSEYICWHFTRSTGESIVHAMLSSVLPYMASFSLFLSHALPSIPLHLQSIQSAMDALNTNGIECGLSAFTVVLASRFYLILFFLSSACDC